MSTLLKEHLEATEVIPDGLLRGGIEIGRIKGKIEAILVVLYARFKGVPLEIIKSLCKTTDDEVLGSLAALAATCSSLDEFGEALK